MRKSTRALVGLAVIDLLVAGGAGWLVLQTRSGAWQTADPGQAIAMIGSVAGGAIGLVTAILLVAFVIHRRAGN